MQPDRTDLVLTHQADGGLQVQYLGVEVIIAKSQGGRGRAVCIVNCDEDKTTLEVNGQTPGEIIVEIAQAPDA